jgi:ankyrin repeat protein
MFSVFMLAAAKALNGHIGGNPSIQRSTEEVSSKTDPPLHTVKFHSTQLLKMAQDIEHTGLGSLDDICLSIFPPLSLEGKPPPADGIIEWMRQQVAPDELAGNWTRAGDGYRWLLRTARTFPEDSTVLVKATAVSLEYLKLVTQTTQLLEDQRCAQPEIDDLKTLKQHLGQELAQTSNDVVSGLLRLHHKQGRDWKCDLPHGMLVFEENEGFDNLMLGFKEFHESVRTDDPRLSAWNRAKLRREASLSDIFDWAPLHYARTSKIVRLLLENGADVNSVDLSGWTPLHYASLRADFPLVHTLLQEKADPKPRGRDGLTPLHCAAIGGNSDVVMALVQTGADLNAHDSLGNTALHWAAFQGHSDAVRNLWQNTNRTSRNRDGRTPIHLAVIGKNYDVLDSIPALGLQDVDVTNRDGRTPLSYAAENGCVKLVELFARSGSPDLVDRLRRSPLAWAIKGGHAGAVEALLATGNVDIHLKDKDRNSPFSHTVTGGQGSILLPLFATGQVAVDADSAGSWGTELLLEAVRSGDVVFVKFLLSLSGVRSRLSRATGGYLLSIAAEGGHETITELLLDPGIANVNFRSPYDGRTPVLCASLAGHEAVVKLLLAVEVIDVNTSDHLGRTPLSWAAMNGHDSIVALLLATGKADIDLKDSDGRMAVDLATNETVAKLLQQYKSSSGQNETS